MKEKIIFERNFKAVGPEGKGIVKATASVWNYEGYESSFSLTETDGCANHKRILEVMPELQIFADLHLCDMTGAPMQHCVADAVHHLRTASVKNLAQHLRVSVKEARSRMAEASLTWLEGKGEAAVRAVNEEVKKASLEVESWLLELNEGRPEKEVVEPMQRLAVEPKAFLNPDFGPWTTTAGRELEKTLGRLFNPASIAVTYKVLQRFGEVPEIRRKTVRLLEEARIQLRAIRNNLKRVLERRVYREQKEWVSAWIEELRPRWKAQAEEAIRILNGEEQGDQFNRIDADLNEGVSIEIDPETEQAVKLDGDIVQVVSLFCGSYLPRVGLGSQEYYLAEDRDSASEAVQEYWRDRVEGDPQEVAELVGESTLVSWALGRRDGPGDCQASSLNDWIENCVGKYPEEEFAAYDGVERDVLISAALAEELGFSTSKLWIEVLAYRCN